MELWSIQLQIGCWQFLYSAFLHYSSLYVLCLGIVYCRHAELILKLYFWSIFSIYHDKSLFILWSLSARKNYEPEVGHGCILTNLVSYSSEIEFIGCSYSLLLKRTLFLQSTNKAYIVLVRIVWIIYPLSLSCLPNHHFRQPLICMNLSVQQRRQVIVT